MTFNLAVILRESARRHPDKTALILGAQSLTYGQLDAASDGVAAVLLQRFSRGDRIAVSMPNGFDFPVTYFGILKAGMVMVPMNPAFTASERSHILADSDAVTLLESCPDWTPSSPDVETSSDDTALIIYTSGTTGRPKGAELSHFQLYLNCTVAGETFGCRFDDVSVAALPFFHIYGLSGILNVAVRYGSTLVVMPRFDANEVLDAMHRHRVTVFAGVPTMYYALLAAEVGDRDLSSLRIGSSGGASMPEAVMRSFEERFGIVILEGYGLSETGSSATMNVPGDRRTGSIGKPIWGVEARVVDPSGATQPAGEVGEIWLRGHVVMKGYHGDPAATANTINDGWLRTGDLAYQDEDGFLYVVDRIKDLIIRGGYNVYPREVEEVLYGHPAIAEAAVIGRPDERLGEEVVAVVAPKPGAEIDAEQVIAFCRERLALYKCPREVRVLDSLPKSGSGKLLKRELRQA